MQIQNSFTVPLPIAAAWPLLLDVPRMARAMPGAELKEMIDNQAFRGAVQVALGPIRLSFAGVARIEEIDQPARRVRVAAKGNDTKGRGSAQAKLVFVLVPEGAMTKVEATTDLQLTGAVAQYGRGAGLIREVANQIVGEFAENLRRDIASRASTTDAPSALTGAAAGESPAPPRPIAGVTLLLRAALAWLRDLFGRRGSAR
jgi:uncharacterized protein